VDASVDHRGWENETRMLTDILMDDARQLAADGLNAEALARLDEALCELLTVPPGYEPHPAFIEYASRLLDEAAGLEEALEYPDDDVDGELMDLPAIEVTDLGNDDQIIGPMPVLPPSDFPLVFNPTVEKFLGAVTDQTEYRARIETGLQRAGAYLPMIRAKLHTAGLPEDLSYLPLIESAFSLTAYSRARAHGMWQFIASTGRHYGLEVGSMIDDRRDPVRSTEAAVAYLGDLYNQFSDWYLALAAYNSGAGNVRRAIRRSGKRDFWSLMRYLPRETRNYVPAFIASVIVAKQPDRFGFPTPQEQEWRFDEIILNDALDLQFLADHVEISLETLQDLNPAIRRDLTPAHGSTSLRLPPGTGTKVEEVLASIPSSEWAPRLIHTVRQGDSLYSIAHAYGSDISAIRQANGIRGSLIRPGQTLLVPRLGVSYPTPTKRVAESGSYTVQRNDTLWHIARSFSVSVDNLCAVNGLTSRQTIHPGQRLVIPDGSAPAAPTAHPQNQTVYRVRTGDTLYNIARKFGTTVDALRRANGIRGSRIYPGDMIKIPKRAAS
jgi:membrane-bound lytic murein transglycosylase D